MVNNKGNGNKNKNKTVSSNQTGNKTAKAKQNSVTAEVSTSKNNIQPDSSTKKLKPAKDNEVNNSKKNKLIGLNVSQGNSKNTANPRKRDNTTNSVKSKDNNSTSTSTPPNTQTIRNKKGKCNPAPRNLKSVLNPKPIPNRTNDIELAGTDVADSSIKNASIGSHPSKKNLPASSSTIIKCNFAPRRLSQTPNPTPVNDIEPMSTGVGDSPIEDTSIGSPVSDNNLQGPIGLENRELTCYMNAMLQALASSSVLIDELKYLNDSASSEKLRTFINILEDINRTSTPEKTAEEVTNSLESFMGNIKWNRTSQQDAFQLLSFIINSIEKEFTPKQIMPPKLKILHTFSENAKFNKVQHHLALALPLCDNCDKKPGERLGTLLDAFFDASFIDDGNHSTTMYLFEKAPTVLILHIQANIWDGELGDLVKPEYYIDYGETLQYQFNIKKEINKNDSIEPSLETYRLMAVVKHFGSVTGGHYITYRRHGDQWYLTNDEQVEKVVPSFSDIVPYVMIYEKL